MSSTSKSRQSLPPMSINPFSTPTSGSTSNNSKPFSSGGGGYGNGHNISGGSMILSSTRIKPQAQSINSGGLSGSKSMGNLRGSSEGFNGSASPISTTGAGAGTGGGDKNNNVATTISKPPKKKNKKGMKGWAWVVEDENGNIIDAPEAEEVISKTTKVNDGKENINNPKSSLNSVVQDDITKNNDSAQIIGKQPSNNIPQNQIQIDNNDLFASSPLPSRASTATAELLPAKRTRKSTSPINEYTSKDNTNNHDALSSVAAQSESGSSAPTPAAIPTTAIPTPTASSSKVPATAKSDSHTKKKRKTSPAPATTPSLIRSNSNSKVPTASNSNGKYKTPRVSTAGSSAPTRAQRALLIRESNSTSRAGSQHVIDDDTPLPPPPPPAPRTGMGEGIYPIPKESYLRNENELLRKEAEFIISETEKHLKELEKEKERKQMSGIIPIEGKRIRKSINYNENDNDGDEDNSMSEGSDDDDDDNVDGDMSGRWEEQGKAGPGPSTSNFRSKRRHHTINGNGNGNNNDNGGFTRRSSINFPTPIKDQSFEGQFNQLQKERKAQILAEKAAEQSRAPNFPKNAKPTVVLANGTINGIGGKTVPRDKLEKSYQDGLSGLSPAMEIDGQGFVDNVKDNLRAILTHYFPERSPRRDAFCERIGRGLAQLGWELTDNSDAALLH